MSGNTELHPNHFAYIQPWSRLWLTVASQNNIRQKFFNQKSILALDTDESDTFFLLGRYYNWYSNLILDYFNGWDLYFS